MSGTRHPTGSECDGRSLSGSFSCSLPCFMESLVATLVSHTAYICTVLLNSLLIYLSASHTKRISETYRHLIIGFAMLGIVFSTFDVVVRPIMHSYNGCFLYFSLESVFRSSKKATEILLAIYSAIYSSILSFLTIQYVFRTCLLMKPHLIHHFEGWKLLLWLGYVFFFGFAWGYITFVHAYPDEYAREYVRSEMFDQYGVDSSDVPLFVLLAYEEHGAEKLVRLQSLICIFGDMGIMALQYFIMMACGVVMYKKICYDLRAVTSHSSHSKIQKQFFKALVYQLAAPSLLVHLPAIPLFFAPFFDMKFSFRTRIVVYFFSFYPLFDSLILFWIISDYKLAMKKIISKWAESLLFYVNTTHPSVVTPGTLSTTVPVAEAVL